MKALTIRQPWASLIAAGVKTIETRSWATKYRGSLAIHAGALDPADGTVVGRWSVYRQADGTRALDTAGTWHPLPLGAIVATANLVDCVAIVGEDGDLDRDDIEVACIEHRPLDAMNGGLWHWPVEDLADEPMAEPADVTDQLPFGDYSPGRCAWLLDNVERCDPIPAKGKQGLWNWDPT